MKSGKHDEYKKRKVTEEEEAVKHEEVGKDGGKTKKEKPRR
jgi:hypothetical protein